jgi:hypothetical protein
LNQHNFSNKFYLLFFQQVEKCRIKFLRSNFRIIPFNFARWFLWYLTKLGSNLAYCWAERQSFSLSTQNLQWICVSKCLQNTSCSGSFTYDNSDECMLHFNFALSENKLQIDNVWWLFE